MNWIATQYSRGTLLFTVSAVLVMAMLARPNVALGQNRTAASLEGTVTDASGGVLPGVTVTAASPSLQVRQLVGITDAEGRYRIVDLTPGAYSVRFELAGFKPYIRESLVLDAGFSARVNASLALGGLEEAITVSGASPLVDTANTGGGKTITTEQLLRDLPGNLTLADVVSLTPGLLNTAGDVPGSLGLTGRPRFSSYGLQSNNTNTTMMIDGFQVFANNPLPDVSATEQTDLKTFGNGADVREPGVAMNLVIKSGGNQFHGGLSEAFMKQPSSNIDDALRARHLAVGAQQAYFDDAGGDLGGRIVTDKVWFYGAYRYRRSKTSQPGLALNPGPDGIYLTGDEPAAFPHLTGTNLSGKVSYQFKPGYFLSGYTSRDETTNEAEIQIAPFGAAVNFAHTPFESTNPFDWKPYVRKVQFKGAPTSHVLFDINFGKSGYQLVYDNQSIAADKPTTYNRSTLLLTGANIPHISQFNYWALSANVSYLPTSFLGGRHEFKAGYFLGRRNNAGARQVSSAGYYSLMYDTVSGVPNVGIQLETRNAPVDPVEWDNTYSIFLSDQWRIGSRLTFNLGLRWDGQHSFVPEQSREAGAFAPAATFPLVDVITRNNMWAPRLGLAWDVKGTGRTLVKATYGWFNPEGSLASTYDKNGSSTTTYKWTDLNGNHKFDPGETNLSLTGPDFISTTSAANNILNPDLKLPHVHEITATFEQELAPGMAIRGLYLFRGNGDQYSSVNTLRPLSIFTALVARRDPGPDGVPGTADDGAPITLYDYTAAFKSSAFVANQNVNRPDGRADYSQSFELGVNRRLSQAFSLTAAYTATKNHIWRVGVLTSPNDDYFPLDTTWSWNSKISGNVNLPRDVVLGVISEIFSAPRGQRTYVFRSTADASGPALPGQTSITLPLEPAGAQQEQAYMVMNVRAAKSVKVSSRSLQVSVDVLNVLDSNAVKAASYVSGPAFRDVTDIVAARQIRLGVQFHF